MPRWLRHLWTAGVGYSRYFKPADLEEIAQAVAKGERTHRAEIVFAVESHLHPLAAFKGLTASARAIEVFSQLKVWDTEENLGVLIYVLTAERDVEVVFDRGLRDTLPAQLPLLIESAVRAIGEGRAGAGMRTLIEALHALLAAEFPSDINSQNIDELPNRAVIL